MPRLIGATVIAGIAALVITTLFKLLLGITVLAGIAFIIGKKAFGKRGQMMPEYVRQQYAENGVVNEMRDGRGGAFFSRAASKKESMNIVID